MTLIATRSRSELRRILTLGLLVITIVLAAGLGSMVFAARAVDHAVATEERELVQRTLQRGREQLIVDLTSATVWDEAYVKTTRSFDPAWAHENYGIYYSTYMHHDRTLVFDPGDRVIYAADAGAIAPKTALASFVADLTPLVETLRVAEAARLAPGLAPPHGLTSVTTGSAFVRSGGEIWAVALSNVLPETGDVPETGRPSAVVLSARRLDDGFFVELQDALGVKDVRLVASGVAASGLSVPINDRQGRPLGRLSWTPKQPGAGILKDALGPILLVLAAFAVAAGALARRVLAVLQSLAENDARLEATLNDLTEARDRAEAANVAKSQFLANISHEIRTPLNGVLGMAQVMERGELVPAQRKHLSIIRESGATLLTLLNDVLDLAKIEAGKLEIERSDTDLTQIVSGACATFQSMAQEKGLKLGFAIEPTAAGVWRVDAMRINQVLTNLIANAVKFTARGQVSVRVWTSTRGLEFSVLDTGVGIPADRVTDLFGKFQQLDASTTRQFGGTGLGLAICYEMVALMGGEIIVESEIGQGSSFSFFLPAEAGRARVAA